MPRPIPTWVYHITRIENVESMVRLGLLSDTRAQLEQLVEVEIGNTGIKQRRAARQVPIEPGGVVADFVPFYFAPRSPMLFAIHCGNVPTYQQGCDDIVYVVTTTQRLREERLTVVGTDRNATKAYAEFTSDDDRLTEIVDWELMAEKRWNDTPDAPDRRERRQAELLVRDGVPWRAVLRVATKSDAVQDHARHLMAQNGMSTPVIVRPGWYF